MDNKYKNIVIEDVNTFDDIVALVSLNSFLLKDDEYLAVYTKRSVMSFLMKDFIKMDCPINYINLDMIDSSCEDDIYLMLLHNDDECSFSIEPAYGKNGNLLSHDANMCLICMDDCGQDIVEYALDTDKRVILFGEEDNQDFDDFDERDCFDDFEDDDWDDFYNAYADEDDYDPYCSECSPKCSWYDECDMGRNMNDKNDNSFVHVSKDRNGDINGVSKSWVEEHDGYKSYSYYAYYSTDSDNMKDIAKSLGIKL